MERASRRAVLKGGIAVAAGGTLLRAGPAHALISVDPTGPALLAAMIANGVTMIKQLADMVQMVQNGVTLLKSLNPASMLGLAANLAQQVLGLNDLLSSINTIGYSLNQVNSEFSRVFPGSTAMAGMTINDFQNATNRWHSELLGVSQIAMRAQSTVTKLQGNADAASQILSNSASAEGAVGQAQANVQMTHLLSTQLDQLIETTDTANRVTATMAATAAAEDDMSEEMRTRLLMDYTDTGAPAPVLTRLP
jgi:type IV secretion system protein TrbJ